MEAKIIYEVVQRLTGKITPKGDSNIDEERLKNVKTFIEVFDMMHKDIDDIAYLFKDDKRASVKKISDTCSGHIDKMGIED